MAWYTNIILLGASVLFSIDKSLTLIKYVLSAFTDKSFTRSGVDGFDYLLFIIQVVIIAFLLRPRVMFYFKVKIRFKIRSIVRKIKNKLSYGSIFIYLIIAMHIYISLNFLYTTIAYGVTDLQYLFGVKEHGSSINVLYLNIKILINYAMDLVCLVAGIGFMLKKKWSQLISFTFFLAHFLQKLITDYYISYYYLKYYGPDISSYILNITEIVFFGLILWYLSGYRRNSSKRINKIPIIQLAVISIISIITTIMLFISNNNWINV